MRFTFRLAVAATTAIPIRLLFCVWLLSAPVVFHGCAFDRAQKAYERGERHLSEGDYRKAIEEYAVVVDKFQSSPYAPKSQYKITYIYNHHLGDMRGAKEAYTRLLFMFPESEEAILARQDMAEAYSSAGDHGKSIEEYQLLIRERPAASSRFRYLIAMEYVKLGDFRQARVEMVELLNSLTNPNFVPYIKYDIANTYYIEGSTFEALRRYDELVSMFPGHKVAVEARLGKAKALDEAGRLGEALAVLNTLKGEYPNEDALKKRIDSIKERLKAGASNG